MSKICMNLGDHLRTIGHEGFSLNPWADSPFSEDKIKHRQPSIKSIMLTKIVK